MELNEKGISIDEIAKRFKLTGSRIRQILSNEPNYCIKHSKYFKNKCSYCGVEESHKKYLSNCKEDGLVKLAKSLSKRGKNKEEIIKKRIYIKILKNKYGYSFSKIGRLLKRHHSTIMSLYYQ